MSRAPEWLDGRAAGLREALCIMQELESGVVARLERRAPYATTTARKTRRQAYRNGIRRIATRLRKAETAASNIDTNLARLGL